MELQKQKGQHQSTRAGSDPLTVKPGPNTLKDNVTRDFDTDDIISGAIVKSLSCNLFGTHRR